jgi:solute carrier family 25 iron transporter 28/37
MTEVDYEALPDNTSLSAQLFAGAMAGITEHAVMHPFDSIKVSFLFFNFKKKN